MDHPKSLVTLERCATYTEQQRSIHPGKMFRIECRLCHYVQQHNPSFLNAALELCQQDYDE